MNAAIQTETIAMRESEDHTDKVKAEISYAAKLRFGCDIQPAKSLTPARKQLLQRLHGMKLGWVSNALIYDDSMRALKKAEQKAVVALLLGGHLRVLRVQGPRPNESRRELAQAEFHYLLTSEAG